MRRDRSDMRKKEQHMSPTITLQKVYFDFSSVTSSTSCTACGTWEELQERERCLETMTDVQNLCHWELDPSCHDFRHTFSEVPLCFYDLSFIMDVQVENSPATWSTHFPTLFKDLAQNGYRSRAPATQAAHANAHFLCGRRLKNIGTTRALLWHKRSTSWFHGASNHVIDSPLLHRSTVTRTITISIRYTPWKRCQAAFNRWDTIGKWSVLRQWLLSWSVTWIRQSLVPRDSSIFSRVRILPHAVRRPVVPFTQLWLSQFTGAQSAPAPSNIRSHITKHGHLIPAIGLVEPDAPVLHLIWPYRHQIARRAHCQCVVFDHLSNIWPPHQDATGTIAENPAHMSQHKQEKMFHAINCILKIEADTARKMPVARTHRWQPPISNNCMSSAVHSSRKSSSTTTSLRSCALDAFSWARCDHSLCKWKSMCDDPRSQAIQQKKQFDRELHRLPLKTRLTPPDSEASNFIHCFLVSQRLKAWTTVRYPYTINY